MTRKIDKRACRKFAIPELEFNLNEGILHVERCPYIIRTAVHNISGQRILVLYIYQSENILAGSIKPRWVMFHSRDDFATLSFRENAKATWQCSTLDSLDRIGGFDSKCAFYRQQDEARVARFCKCERGAISVLGYLQRLISRHRELERKWKKQRAIIERMKYVPVLPRDLKGFIHREVMPQYIFYDYQRKGPERAFCTACRHEVSIAAAKHNASGTCPRCKKKITFKSRGKRGRIFDRATVQVLQKAEGNGLVLRIIKVYRSFADSDIPNHFEIWENARQFITLSSSGQCSVDAYYYHYKAGYDLTPWCNGYRPVFDRWKYNFTADMSGVLYQRNLSDTLKDTPWAYSQLEAFSGIASFSGVATFLSAYIKRPKIEHLIKMKLYRLVSGIIYGGYSYSALQAINFNGENMRAILGIYGAQTSLFAPMIDRQPQKCACKLLMPLPEETRLYMGQHQISYAPEYMMDRSGNLYMYLECLKAAVETEGVFACDEDGQPPAFSAVREGKKFLQVYTYEEAVERLEQAEDAG